MKAELGGMVKMKEERQRWGGEFGYVGGLGA